MNWGVITARRRRLLRGIFCNGGYMSFSHPMMHVIGAIAFFMLAFMVSPWFLVLSVIAMLFWVSSFGRWLWN